MEKHSILVVAGEASADAHAASVLRALYAQQGRQHLHAFGVGGALMQQQGFDCVVDAKNVSVAGFTEVITSLPRILMGMAKLKQAIQTHRPKVALLLDLPDYNLRLAPFLKKLGIPIVYYISPQIWAWRIGRIKLISRYVDKMLVILPFESDFYQSHGVSAEFVGHPLVEELAGAPSQPAARQQLALLPQKPCIALLPGSRRHEVMRHLPVMLQSLQHLQQENPELQAVMPVASTIDSAWITPLIKRYPVTLTMLPQQATAALAAADVCVVCSGTATLQAALLQRPMVVVYRASWLTYWIVRLLVRIGSIGLVNLIARKNIVPELIQHRFTVKALLNHIRNLLNNRKLLISTQQALAEVAGMLGSKYPSRRVAEVVGSYLSKPPLTPSTFP